jgi:hypothetical protein
MKFHVLQSLSNFLDRKKRIDAFHATMYHGTADRGGLKPDRKSARLAYEVDRPLQLHKNAYDIGHIIEPEGFLVVSEIVRDALRESPGITCAPVKFKTLFTYPYAEGDFSFWKTMPDYNQQQEFIDSQRDDAALHQQVGPYFELVAPWVRDLKHRYSPLSELTVLNGNSILISREMLQDNPVYSSGAKVMTESVFAKIEPFVNWTYFEHGEGSI